MQVKTQIDELQNYLSDASNLPGGHAEKLFIPQTIEEIAGILREANQKNISVTISGARTGLVGGCIPFGGYLISLEKFNQIKEINGNFAIAQAAVRLNDFQKETEAKGLFIRLTRPNGVANLAERWRPMPAVHGASNTAQPANLSNGSKSSCRLAIFYSSSVVKFFRILMDLLKLRLKMAKLLKLEFQVIHRLRSAKIPVVIFRLKKLTQLIYLSAVKARLELSPK